MRKKSSILILLLCAAGSLAFLDRPTQTALSSIRPEDVRRHIDFLASDALLGRNTPSPELDRAARYLAAEFEKYGLQPVNGSYFQTFHLDRIRLGKENFVTVTEPSGTELELKIKRDFMPYQFTADGEAAGELVFVGYGITAPEYDYDDYAGLDVRGKVAVVLKHEPGEKDEQSPFAGRKPTEYSKLRAKVENAIAHGAAGLLVITDPLNHRSLRPRGFPWPSLYKNIPDAAVPYTLSILADQKIPVVQVGKRFVKSAFGGVESLRQIQAVIDSSGRPNSFALEGFRVVVRTSLEVESTPTQNVVALREGSDPELKKQLIVVGAHYDHVGYKPGQADSGEDYIYNGADDNASGTVALLEVAEAFSRQPRPRRSVLFIAFAGEEKGLFGSRYYVEQPLWPLSQTRAMFNMDMVGRNQGDRVSIIGYRHSPDLKRINEAANKYVGMDLRYDGEEFFRRSDHYNFARKKIPVLFYNTGLHKDYHKVSDNPDKINVGKIATVARLVFRTVWHAANTAETFRYVEPE